MSNFAVINGVRYNRILDIYGQKSTVSTASEYLHSLCCKNLYNVMSWGTFEYTGSAASFNVFLMASTNVLDSIVFYDFETNVVIDSAESLSRYGFMNTLTGIPNYVSREHYLSLNAFKGTGYNYLMNNRTNLNMQPIDSSIFNPWNYTDVQIDRVFHTLNVCGFSLSGGTSFKLHSVRANAFIDLGYNVYTTYNDLKIGYSLWIKNSFNSGKIIETIDNTIFAIDWTVYIDGTYNPTIKITWDSEYMNFEEMGNTFDASKAFIGYGSESPFNVDWESGSFTTSYKEVVKVLYPSIYEKIIEGVGSLLDAPSFSIRLLGATLNGGVQINSGTCFFVMSSKGTVSESGLAEGSENLSDTITIVYGNDDTGGGDKESNEPGENDNPSEGEEISVKGFNLLTLTYALTPNRLAQLGSFIWGASFLTNLKLVNNNPIENIVSCKMFPFTVGGGADTSIKLGNVETGINGNPVSSGGYSAKKVINGFTIAPLFNNFLDYEPYTKISVFLPFIGIKELQPSQIMNKVLSLEYVVDIVTGICKCIVKSGGKQIADYDGSIGIDIPITSSNRAQVELSYITSALGVVGSIAMGSPLGVVGSVLSGASSSYHSETKGTSSPVTGVYGALTPFVIFDRPKYTLPGAYGQTKGFVCNKTYTLGSLSGFTVCHENVKLSGISCTNEELEEIKSLLTSGFFA